MSTSKMPKYFADLFFFNIMLMYLQEQLRNPTAKHSEKGHANAGFGPRNVFSTEVLCRDRIGDFFFAQLDVKLNKYIRDY